MSTHSRQAGVARNVRAIAATALALSLSLACSGDPATGEPRAAGEAIPAAVPSGPPPTVEELAGRVDCEPDIQVDAVDMRQGYCETSVGRFFVTTFVTQSGKDQWMDTAPEYNPHLVGNLWTVLASRKVLDELREELGGDLHLTDHRVTPAPAVTPAG
ncbi:hypothetical protein [Streptosporangium lutulentum]|uniref:Lipoprotein n=1 Tax=Streptosporangium lutulentum TaxID=1461250 RepID=A0ABT9QUM3_9ACTN|nr:hypothetical protein [Streptosporangium lutulentum]MDP9849993.1 hypothetical protein [Streptosporangium lutulentum]